MKHLKRAFVFNAFANQLDNCFGKLYLIPKIIISDISKGIGTITLIIEVYCPFAYFFSAS